MTSPARSPRRQRRQRHPEHAPIPEVLIPAPVLRQMFEDNARRIERMDLEGTRRLAQLEVAAMRRLAALEDDVAVRRQEHAALVGKVVDESAARIHERVDGNTRQITKLDELEGVLAQRLDDMQALMDARFAYLTQVLNNINVRFDALERSMDSMDLVGRHLHGVDYTEAAADLVSPGRPVFRVIRGEKNEPPVVAIGPEH